MMSIVAQKVGGIIIALFSTLSQVSQVQGSCSLKEDGSRSNLQHLAEVGARLFQSSTFGAQEKEVSSVKSGSKGFIQCPEGRGMYPKTFKINMRDDPKLM
jgi:hypothetical protein